ncbi:MAG: GNAT family N-acetyltransferase [Janthinobacterium lividum]
MNSLSPPNLFYSASESARFDLRIFRGSLAQWESHELRQAIEDECIDVAILRIPTSEQYRLSELSNLPYPVLVADTLVTFDGDLRRSPLNPLYNSRLAYHQATMADQAALEELVDLSFKEYRTHYHSNPLFDPKLVLEGYKEWAMSCLNPDDKRVCFLYYVDGQAVAFTTNMVHADYGEGIIFGARPNVPSRGLYTDLIRHTKQYMHEQGLRRVRATTQIQNHGVQRVWAREGLLPTQSHCTVHINALLHQKQKLASSVGLRTVISA